MRILTRLACSAALLALAACTGGSTLSPSPVRANPTPTATGTAVATVLPTSPPTPSPDFEVDLRLVSNEAVLEASALGDGHYTATLPAAYFVADDVHHLYVVGFGAARGDQRVFHATSADGLAWEVEAADPFGELGLELSPPGPVPGSVVQDADGGWSMYLWGVPAPQSEGALIYRATAAAPAGPWIADTEPVVALGDAGDWDDVALDFPAVVRSGDGYLMLYGANGTDHPNAARVGLARSQDGIDWDKAGEVLQPEICGGAAADFTAIPRLIPLDGSYFLLVVIGTDIAALRSLDAVEWTCVGEGPIFLATEIPGNERVHTIAATQTVDGISVLIEALIDGGSELWLAEVDGL